MIITTVADHLQEILLDSLSVAQSRDDFQWSLHQLGGFNALLFLYARVSCLLKSLPVVHHKHLHFNFAIHVVSQSYRKCLLCSGR